MRDFTPGNQTAVRELVLGGMRERWGDAYDPSANPDLDDTSASYINRGAEVVVVDIEAEIVATGALLPERNRRGRIVRMSVDGAHRGKGFGRQVVEELVRRARRRGMTEVLVLTDTPWTAGASCATANDRRASAIPRSKRSRTRAVRCSLRHQDALMDPFVRHGDNTDPVVSSAMVLARVPLVLVVLGFAITTVSCSSDDPSGDPLADTSAAEDQESVHVLTSFFRQSGEADPNAVQYDDDAARCMAEGLLEVLGEARLADLGLDTATGDGPTLATPPLDEAESALVYELMMECVDLIEQTAALFEDTGMSRADAACTASEYANSGLLAESLASEQFDPELNRRIDEAIRAAMADCGVEGTL